MLQQIFQQPGNKIFLQTQNKAYTYQWLQQRIKKTLGLFRSLNIKQGDRIVLAVSDDTEMTALFLSSLIAGIGAVITDPEIKAPRANAIVDRSRPAGIIADKESLDKWSLSLPEGCRAIPFVKENTAKPGLLSKFLQKNKTAASSDDYTSLLEKVEFETSLPLTPDLNALAYIIFTSGTTTESKGVAITHGNLAAHLATLQKVYGLHASSATLNQLLLSHADGIVQGPVLAAYVGCTWHRPFRFALEKIPATLDYCFAHNISHFFTVPAMLNLFVQFDDAYEDSFLYPEFKALISVSAHLDAPLWDKFEAVFKVPVSNVYGLTETVAGSLFCGPQKETHRKYTVGKPDDCELRIVTEDGKEVSRGETGELLLKGPHIMKSYWADSEMTIKAFKDGWFCTGDLVSQDEEDFVTIKGRKKNLIISGGFNIQPEEVTESLLQHPDVLEAAALGLPDEVFGEKLVAAVVLKPGSNINSIQIVAHCRNLLEERKVPHNVFILSSLPKGVSGKVQTEVLKGQLGASRPSQTSGGHFEEEVLRIAAEAFQAPALRLNIQDTSNTIAGWDSLAHLVFVTGLEEKYKIRFSTAEIITMNSIQKAVNLVKEKHG